MQIKSFINKNLLPHDGSYEIIDAFARKLSKIDGDICLFPDVHYKKGSKVVNGMLLASPSEIFPSMLGVENCGFTFGKLSAANISPDLIEKSVEAFAKKTVNFSNLKRYDKAELLELLQAQLSKDYDTEITNAAKQLMGWSSKKHFINSITEILDPYLLKQATHSLNTLGGGNHFLELHRVTETWVEDIKLGDLVFIVHSDSVKVGEIINLIFSNLSELHYLKGFEKIRSILKYRWLQIIILKKYGLFKDVFQFLNLILSRNDFRSIKLNSLTGRLIVKYFTLASAFGTLNRDIMTRNFLMNLNEFTNNVINYDFHYSHSHDSIRIEETQSGVMCVQRNGVQRIDRGSYLALPGALGTPSYLMKSEGNQDAYESTNHGVGRLVDKHKAKTRFTPPDVDLVSSNAKMKIYNVGSGDLREQNAGAFKDVDAIVHEMSLQGLAVKAAKLQPISSIKG